MYSAIRPAALTLACRCRSRLAHSGEALAWLGTAAAAGTNLAELREDPDLDWLLQQVRGACHCGNAMIAP
jgi:hypothetical protein